MARESRDLSGFSINRLASVRPVAAEPRRKTETLEREFSERTNRRANSARRVASPAKIREHSGVQREGLPGRTWQRPSRPLRADGPPDGVPPPPPITGRLPGSIERCEFGDGLRSCSAGSSRGWFASSAAPLDRNPDGRRRLPGRVDGHRFERGPQRQRRRHLSDEHPDRGQPQPDRRVRR